MTTTILEGKVLVTRLAGPAIEGEDRARWQLFIPDEIATLGRDEVEELVHALGLSLRIG